MLAVFLVAVAVVDDDASILDAMTLLIEGQGWDAMAYVDGQAFLDEYRQNDAIDCLILDPHLNGLSGVDVAHALLGSTIPVIVLTARPESSSTKIIDALDAVMILTKPVRPDDLVAAITSVIN